MRGNLDTCDLESAHLYACGGVFQVLKDWEVSLRVVGDEPFFHFCQKSWIRKVYWVPLEMLLVGWILVKD